MFLQFFVIYVTWVFCLCKQHTYSISVDLIVTIGVTHDNNYYYINWDEIYLCSSNKNREEIQIMKLPLYSGIKNQPTNVTFVCYFGPSYY